MAWQKRAGIFQVRRAFEHRLDKVATRTDNRDDEAASQTEPKVQVGNAIEQIRCRNGEHNTSDEPFDGLLRRYAFVEFMPAKRYAAKVCASVVGPSEDEQADYRVIIVVSVFERQEVEQRVRQAYVDDAHKRQRNVHHLILILAEEFEQENAPQKRNDNEQDTRIEAGVVNKKTYHEGNHIDKQRHMYMWRIT